ncbi:helix-turn-helix domain-containing protein [Propionicicella superfundia]|uniref:helix-turn-helix domain-containing protein n=1 Tax=Propionicicella superfundia TaxID=348582 RepID=UPI000415823C|nr:helix-turn-helix transcriptional regulator [Propionicicella superfundia]
MAVTQPAFGVRLRQLRRERGMSQVELGGEQFTGSYISHLESGRREPTPAVTAFLSERLGVTSFEVFPEEAASVRDGSSDLETLEHLLAAERAWHDQEWRLATRNAGRAAALAAASGNAERAWEARFVLAQALLSDGDYGAVSRLAKELIDDQVASRSASLKSQALSLMSVASRASGHLTDAITWGARAVEASRETAVMLQAEAVMALIGARSEAGDRGHELVELCHWLGELREEVESGYSRGLISWTLGTAAFQRKDIARGIHHLEGALEHIKPQRDLRMWARLHKTIANNRVEAGLDEGVETSLQLAREGLRLVGNPSDLLELHLVEVKVAYRDGDHARAESLVRHCLAEEALHQADHLAGEAERLLGEICVALDKSKEAKEAFARSATRFESAGAFGQASASWHLHAQTSE